MSSIVKSLAPIAKIQNVGISGSVSTLLIYVAGLRGVQMPPEVAAAIVTVAGSVAGYLTSLKPKEVKLNQVKIRH
ncbi:MAG: hypothetical protein MH252_08530 [Thermosynechococcaceae cyanobacterium MS004]|nr:hypothetical protein [Thermosynechococcaceae cyanobacterium MS004]